MKNTYIVNGCRTPIGSFGGTLASVRPDDMLSHVIKHLVTLNPDMDPGQIDDVIMGCANQAGEDNRNIARMSGLLAGLPYTVPGETVNRLCASGMSAVIHAHRAIHTNEGQLFIAGGVENMTRGPWVISKTSSAYGRDAKMYDSSFGWRFINPQLKELYGIDAMGDTAENLAEMYNISRERQDAFAYNSQVKAKNALDSGFFKEEIVPIPFQKSRKESGIYEHDEFPRPNTDLSILGNLSAAFKQGGSVTAGNSSGLNDGAIAMLIASDEGLKTHKLEPIARIVSSAVKGVEPRIMGIGPVPATNLALKRAGLTLDQMDIIELNEAFAAQSIACLDALNLSIDDERINPQGGAIALGHPLGMTGARLLHTAALQLRRTNKRYALCTMCVGVGQGYAVILERV
ncbi:MAG: acetyl-CoA C-acyltransferase [Saprospiraceae bacterium]|uniref:acetyl-CoA C-acyltransferase n=1 Tax=Candidatus Brachybacter algidus TaxID=2982024 RepID=UPI001B6C671B|nr:acetyl-CoA C-acyltransferase [Candidatus Brachybacter algidus]MBP7541231.1 acetyl-CoA C-acyltransferase [Saprospiraceae bacterium]MBK7604590.1 acetyl-CoA C-acyltransferase [Candidatus Brachybacter algidus]MBP8893468.1 acetyl-CoA C-acyltransferase [Saprospiraceae bacterium]MBP9125465.1 acetyl-CoA C-acyltransferase [Saprospiraceae bacterium]MBP9847249.1 acetyl-CoA C-acyltransferase [Saprospiraceae bacterium]